MPRPWRLRYAGAKYHLTVRGNGRSAVFLDAGDYARFVEQMDEALEADEVLLYAYCLMPNHYHLFVETPLGNVQRFMQRLNTAYGMYFRYRHKRPGHCFQGRYGAKLVAGDAYILALTRYIHLNPVKIESLKRLAPDGRREQLRRFPHSSYRGYAGLSEQESRIDYRWLELLGGRGERGRRKAYAAYVEGMVAAEDSAFISATQESRYAIGDEAFRAGAEDELRQKRLERAVTGDILWPEDRRPAVATVAEVAADALGVALSDLRGHGNRHGGRKAVVVEWCCRMSGETQREVGRYLGYRSDAGVGLARKRAAVVLGQDQKLAAMEEVVRRRLTAVSKHRRGRA